MFETQQILEQEKHILRRKVDAVEGEYESKVSELQSDVADLRRLLEEQTNNVKIAERQKSSIITQLTEQNQRLTAQLKEVKNQNDNFILIPPYDYCPTNRVFILLAWLVDCQSLFCLSLFFLSLVFLVLFC